MAGRTSVFGSTSPDFNIERGSSSCGNQEKFRDGDKFFKFDHLGYEGISEVIASRLAKHMTIASYGVTEYFPFSISVKGKQRMGCFSKSFNPNRYKEITLYKILTSYHNTDLAGVYKIYEETYDTLTLSFFDFVRELIYDLYGYDILPWMTQLLKFDWLVLNEDRHFRNISFLLNGSTLLPAPLFDNGAALLSDLDAYPPNAIVDICMSQVRAKPFNSSFETQVHMIEKYQCEPLRFLKDKVLVDISDLRQVYSENLISRAVNVLCKQMKLLYPGVEVDFKWK